MLIMYCSLRIQKVFMEVILLSVRSIGRIACARYEIQLSHALLWETNSKYQKKRLDYIFERFFRNCFSSKRFSNDRRNYEVVNFVHEFNRKDFSTADCVSCRTGFCLTSYMWYSISHREQRLSYQKKYFTSGKQIPLWCVSNLEIKYQFEKESASINLKNINSRKLDP